MSQLENIEQPSEVEDSTEPSSSPRRIAASRENGALSHGPTTSEGRAASAAASKNSRHGMLAQTVVLASESRQRFEELLDALIAEHCPFTKSERALVETMAVARWRQMRSWSIQKNDFDREISKYQSGVTAPVAAAIAYRSLNDSSNSLNNAIRHETTFERQFNRALRELKFLKANPGNPIESFGPASVSSTWDLDTETFDNQAPQKKSEISI